MPGPSARAPDKDNTCNDIAHTRAQRIDLVILPPIFWTPAFDRPHKYHANKSVTLSQRVKIQNVHGRMPETASSSNDSHSRKRMPRQRIVQCAGVQKEDGLCVENGSLSLGGGNAAPRRPFFIGFPLR